MISVGYFLLSCSIFLIFTSLITIFGYFFQYYIFSGFKSKKVSLGILLESFGIGTGLFILYSYFIIDTIKLFNFFTIYLPLIIFDGICFLYFIWNNRKIIIKDKFQIFIKNFHQLISTIQDKSRIYILLITFLLFLIVQSVIETNLSLPAKDPYNWFDIILYLHRYGDLNYDNYTVHGVGFVIFTAAALLVTNNFYIQYYFIKYISTFFFSIIILTIYNIASKFFKKNHEILITLITLLCFNSLLFRFSLAVPSIIATTLGIIFFNTLIQNDNMRLFLIRGILLGGIFLIHPLYFLFVFGFYILFEVLMLAGGTNRKLKKDDYKISEEGTKFIKKNGILLLITLLFSIPYFLNLYISGKSLYKNFTRYLFRGYEADTHDIIFNSVFSICNVFLLNLKPSRTDVLYNLVFFGLDLPVNKTLNWGVLFLILGLFFKFKSSDEQLQYLIGYIKFTFIATFLLFIISSFLFISDNVTMLSLASFIIQYGKRIFESFSPIWALLFVLGIKKTFEFIKKLKIKKIQGYNITKEIKIADIERKLEKTYLLALLVLGSSLYASHLYFQYNVIYSSHYEDDYLTEALLFIGDYFNKKNIEDETILLPDNFDSKVIYRLIYHKDIDRDYLEFDNTNHTELMDAIDENEADFVLVYKLETKSSCLDKINDREEVLYENPNYLFFKV